MTLASIGDIITLFLDEIKLDDISLYYLIFLFFALMLSYGLPNKIGTIILAKPMEEKNQEGEENIDNKDNIDNNKKAILEDENENDVPINNLELNNVKLK